MAKVHEVRRFGKQRAEHLEDQLAGLMRAAFDTGEIAYIGGLEGPLRAGIRANLCLGGWKWLAADKAAMVTVEGALRRVRAVRPGWYEGQREWTVSAGDLIQRTRCVKCHKPLPEGHFKYCGRLCANSHHKQMENLRDGNEATVVRVATWSIA